MKFLTTSLLASLALPLAADIITLKDGTKLDAVILSKTLEEYELEVSITKSIKEPRTIKRSDVVDVETVSQHNIDFKEKIAVLVPIPAFSKIEVYEARIKIIEKFIADNERTSAASQAKKILTTIQEERAFIAEGGIKTSLEKDGLISQQDYEKNSLAIDAQASAATFQQHLDKRSFLAALREYDVLERNFFGTQAHRDTVPKMKKFSRAYSQLLLREISSLDASAEQRMETMKRLSDSDFARVEKAKADRQAKLEKIWTMEKEKNISWMTIDTQDSNSLEQAIRNLNGEEDRLAKVDTELANLEETGELFSKGWMLAGEKKREELEEILSKLETARTPESYVKQLVDRFDPAINNPPATEEAAPESEPTE